jgi:hypothetical protein
MRNNTSAFRSVWIEAPGQGVIPPLEVAGYLAVLLIHRASESDPQQSKQVEGQALGTQPHAAEAPRGSS